VGSDGRLLDDAGPLPADTEARLADFTELVATAIANSEAQAEVARLAEEQAALRRVATLVAQGVPADALFGAVCDEVEALAGAEVSAVLRFEGDGTVTFMGAHSVRQRAGARLELDPDFVVAEVRRTGRAARFDTDDPAAPGIPRSSGRGGSAPRSRVRSSSRASSGRDHGRLARAHAPGRHEAPARRLHGVGGDRDRHPAGTRGARRLSRASPPPTTRSAAGSSAICTTARSSALSTR
jgi:hypothetical protein